MYIKKRQKPSNYSEDGQWCCFLGTVHPVSYCQWGLGRGDFFQCSNRNYFRFGHFTFFSEANLKIGACFLFKLYKSLKLYSSIISRYNNLNSILSFFSVSISCTFRNNASQNWLFKTNPFKSFQKFSFLIFLTFLLNWINFM